MADEIGRLNIILEATGAAQVEGELNRTAKTAEDAAARVTVSVEQVKAALLEQGIAFNKAGRSYEVATGALLSYATEAEAVRQVVGQLSLEQAQQINLANSQAAAYTAVSASMGVASASQAHLLALQAEALASVNAQEVAEKRLSAVLADISVAEAQSALAGEARAAANEASANAARLATIEENARAAALAAGSTQAELNAIASTAAADAALAQAAAAELSRIAIEAEALGYIERNKKLAEQISVENALEQERFAQKLSRMEQIVATEEAQNAAILKAQVERVAAENSIEQERFAAKLARSEQLMAIDAMQAQQEAATAAAAAAPRLAAEAAVQRQLFATAVVSEQRAFATETVAAADAAAAAAATARTAVETAAATGTASAMAMAQLEAEALRTETVAAELAARSMVALTVAEEAESAASGVAATSTSRLSASLLAMGYSAAAVGGILETLGIEAGGASGAMLTLGHSGAAAGRGLKYAGAAGAETGAVMAFLTNPVTLAAAAIVGLGAVGVGSALELRHMANEAGHFGEQLFVARAETGLSINNLLALKVAGEATGTTLEQLSQTVKMMFRRNVEAEGGNNRLSKSLQAVGIDTTDSNKALAQFIDYLGKFPAGEQRTAAALGIAGRSGQKFAEITDIMGGSLENFRAELDALNINLGEDSVNAAQKYITEQAKLNTQLEILEFKIESLAFPIVLSAMKSLSGWVAKNNDQIIAWGDDFVSAMTAAVEIFTQSGILDGLKDMVGWLAQNRDMIKEFATEVANLTSLVMQLASVVEQPFQLLLQVSMTGTSDALALLHMLQVGSQDLFGGGFGAGYDSYGNKLKDPGPSPALRAFTKQRQKEQEDMLFVPEKPPKPFWAPRDAKKKRGGGGAAESATKTDIEIARVELKMLEEYYKNLLGIEKSFYDQSVTSSEEYTRLRISDLNDRRAKELSIFQQQQSEITSGKFKHPGQRDLAQKKLEAEELAAKNQYYFELMKLDDEQYKIQQDQLKQHTEVMISIQQSGLNKLETINQMAVTSGAMNPMEAEAAQFEESSQIYAAQIQKLVGQIQALYSRAADLARKNPSLAASIQVDPAKEKEIADQINLLLAQQEAAAQQHAAAMIAAEKQWIDSIKDAAQKYATILRGTQDLDAETLAIRLEIMDRYTGDFESSIRHQEALEIDAEHRRRERMIQDLNDQLAYLKRLDSIHAINHREAVEQEGAIRKEIEAVNANSDQKILNAHSKAQEELMNHYRETAGEIADILQNGIDNGWKGILDSTKKFLQQLSVELNKSIFLQIFHPEAAKQGSKAGGILGDVTNKILETIGVKSKTPAVGSGVDAALMNNTSVILDNTQATRELTVALGSPYGKLGSSFTDVLSSLDLGGGSTYTPGGTGATRPRRANPFPTGGSVTVTPGHVASAAGVISSTISHEALHTISNDAGNTSKLLGGIQAGAETIIQGLKPAQQGFWSGLLMAAISGAASGLVSGLTAPKGGGGGGQTPNVTSTVTELGSINPDTLTRPRRVGGHAAGGKWGPNEIFPINERGPEPMMYTGETSGYMVPHESYQNSGGGEKTVNVHVHVNDKRNRSVSPARSRREMAEQIGTIIQNSMR